MSKQFKMPRNVIPTRRREKPNRHARKAMELRSVVEAMTVAMKELDVQDDILLEESFPTRTPESASVPESKPTKENR